MTKLLITEITRMGPAFCVIGLQREKDRIRSVRPVSATANSWLHFPYHRGDVLQCDCAPFSGSKPHIEDRVLTGAFQKESCARRKSRALYRNYLAAFSMKTRVEVDSSPSHPKQSARSVERRRRISASSFTQTNFAPRWLFPRAKSCAIFP
jgi:hypothetical protein